MSPATLPGPVLDDDDPTLFPKLTDEQVQLLGQYGQVRPTHVGDVLFREGEASHNAMVLLEGLVAVVIGSGSTARDLCVQQPRDLMVEFSIVTGEQAGARVEFRS